MYLLSTNKTKYIMYQIWLSFKILIIDIFQILVYLKLLKFFLYTYLSIYIYNTNNIYFIRKWKYKIFNYDNHVIYIY